MSQDSPKRIALVLNTLTNGELKGGKRDVSRVYSILTNPEQGMCLPNKSTPIHDCGNRDGFEKVLRSTLQSWDIKTQLVFYFSGHGDIRGNNQFCLKMGLDNSEWYPFKNLMNELELAGVKRAIIILDACHSGAAVEGSRNSDNNIFNSIKQDDIPQGIAIIASSRKTQTSQELLDGSSGVFTDIFCTGIETSLDEKGTNDGKIYVEDIVSYIENKLSTEEKYSTFTQRPVFSLDRAEKKIWIAQGKKREYSTQANVKSSHSIRTPEELQILYEQTHPNRHPCPQATIEDIDLEVLEKYANKVEPELYKTANLEEVLSKLKLYSPIQDGGSNVLHKSAVLCFHKRPEMIYPQARSVFVFGRPRESNFVRQDIFGPLSSQVEALVEKVKKYSETISYIAEDGLRREVEEIDLRVARELISNAIAHRDYQLTGTVKVTITSEALEVYSPGRFSPGLSWEKLIDGIAPVSNPVDEAISLYLLNLLAFEGIGRGFDVFKEYIKENGSDSILCRELPGPTTYIRVLRRANRRTIPDNKNIVNQYKEKVQTSILEASLQFLQEIFDEDQDILKVFTLNNLEAEAIKEHFKTGSQQFAEPINMYVTGRTGAGKTALGNNFLIDFKMSSTGFQNCTKEIGYFKLASNLAYYDEPGACDDVSLENLNRASLLMPQIEDQFNEPPIIPLSDSDELEILDFTHCKTKTDRPEKKFIPLTDWQSEKIQKDVEPDVIIYVLAPHGKFLQPDRKYLGELLQAWKKHKKNRCIVITALNIFRKENGTIVPTEQEITYARTEIAKIYRIVYKDSSIPPIVDINSKTGEGIQTLTEVICQILPPDKIGNMQQVLQDDLKEFAAQERLNRYYHTLSLIAARLSRVPINKTVDGLNLFQTAASAICAYGAMTFKSPEAVADIMNEFEAITQEIEQTQQSRQKPITEKHDIKTKQDITQVVPETKEEDVVTTKYRPVSTTKPVEETVWVQEAVKEEVSRTEYVPYEEVEEKWRKGWGGKFRNWISGPERTVVTKQRKETVTEDQMVVKPVEKKVTREQPVTEWKEETETRKETRVVGYKTEKIGEKEVVVGQEEKVVGTEYLIGGYSVIESLLTIGLSMPMHFGKNFSLNLSSTLDKAELKLQHKLSPFKSQIEQLVELPDGEQKLVAILEKALHS
ncbi:MAG: caspase family protein [Cyanobacteria bacterium P01_H01_bin.35]